jgi:hypothetical protein
MHNYVGAKFERLLEIGALERVIYDNYGPLAVREFGHAFNVDNP